MIQSYGDMSVEFIVELYRQIPTLKGVKDETTGSPIAPHPGIQKLLGDKFVVMAAHNCIQMLDELRAGFDGYVPIITYADLLQTIFELGMRASRRKPLKCSAGCRRFRRLPERRNTS